MNKKIASYLLFVATGFISAWIFQLNDDFSFGTTALSGLLFIISCVMLFYIAGIPLQSKRLRYYISLQLFSYGILFCVTVMTGYFAVITGPLTASIGAMITFYLTKKYIVAITYKEWQVMTAGAIPFILISVFSIESVTNLIEQFYPMDNSLTKLFAPVYLFWQPLVGILLAFRIFAIKK